MTVINGYPVSGGKGFVNGVYASVNATAGTETILDSIFIPGGTFVSNDVITIQCAIIRSNMATNANMTLRIYWNQTPDLTTPTLLSTTFTANTDDYLSVYRRVSIVNSNTTDVLSPAELNPADILIVNSSSMSRITSINWGIDGYIVVSGQNTVATTLRKIYLTILR